MPLIADNRLLRILNPPLTTYGVTGDAPRSSYVVEEREPSVRQIEELYIPADERTLHRVQRKAEEVERSAREWAELVVDFLPAGLTLLQVELYLLRLFLAQQRRLNLELDARNPEPTFRSHVLGRVLPFIRESEAEREMTYAAHRIVATQLESDIDRACETFCLDLNVPPISDPAIDWRVAIRYLAQGMHRIVSRIDMKREYVTSPKRFELALFARESVTDIVSKRCAISEVFTKGAV